jgi:hypothetical protein
MFTRLTEDESALYELSARFSREIMKRVSKQQYVDIIYGIHLNAFLQKVIATAMQRAWKRVFEQEMKDDHQTIATVEKVVKIFREQAQKAYEKFHLVNQVAEA